MNCLCSWRSQNYTRCLLSIPLQPAVGDASLALLIQIALLNPCSITNKSLSELLTRKSLDFMFLTKTWQREGEIVHLNKLCSIGCSVIGVPRLALRGGELTVVYSDRYLCREINSDNLPSFESQMIKTGLSNVFYCVLIYFPPCPAGAFLNDNQLI